MTPPTNKPKLSVNFFHSDGHENTTWEGIHQMESDEYTVVGKNGIDGD